MSNPITIIECQPVNSLYDLQKEYERQYKIQQEKYNEARKLKLHNSWSVDYYGLQGMAIKLLQSEYGFTEKQAQLIEAKCYEDHHAYFSDYLGYLPDFARFAEEIIAASK